MVPDGASFPERSSGEFRYLADVGPIVGGVPVTLPLFFVPLALNAYLLATPDAGELGWG